MQVQNYRIQIKVEKTLCTHTPQTHIHVHMHAESLTCFWFVQWCCIYSTGALAGWLMLWLRLCWFCQSETSSQGAELMFGGSDNVRA